MKIIYEDKDLIVVEKPAGVPVETSRVGLTDMVSLLRNHLAAASTGQIPYLGVIHRLDQPVQGVMVFAKNKKAARNLSAQISNGEMQKTYLAVTCGIAKENDSLTDYLQKDGRTNTSRIVRKGAQDAKEARLNYVRRETLPAGSTISVPLSLVEIHLFTGRHHQIRVQMAGAGFPLYGDQKYNPTPIGSSAALCAWKLSLLHPSSGKKLTFSCTPADEIFQVFHV